jgi:hypothetical protein
MRLDRLFPPKPIIHTRQEMGLILETKARELFPKAGDRLPQDIFEIGINRNASVSKIIEQLKTPYLDLMQKMLDQEIEEPIESNQLNLLDKIITALQYSELWKKTSASINEIEVFSKKTNVPSNISEIILRQKNHKDRYSGRDYDLSLIENKYTYFKEWSDRGYKPVTGSLKEPEALKAMLKHLSPNAHTEMTDIMWMQYPENNELIQWFSDRTPSLGNAPHGIEYPIVNSNGPHLHLHTASRIPNETDLLMWTLYDNETLNAENAILQQTQAILDKKNKLLVVMQHASSQLPPGKDLSHKINPSRVKNSQLSTYVGELPVNHLGGIPYTLSNSQYEVSEVINQRAKKLDAIA